MNKTKTLRLVALGATFVIAILVGRGQCTETEGDLGGELLKEAVDVLEEGANSPAPVPIEDDGTGEPAEEEP